MIRFAVLASFAAILTLLAFASERPARNAEALIPPIPCDAKIGVVDNEGLHPFAWPYLQPMNFTQQPENLDGSRDFNLAPVSGSTPIPISGAISADGDVTGNGNGSYSGFPTGTQYLGDITYYDMNHVHPRRIIGDYTIGGQGELPGSKTVAIRVDCFFDPPTELADPDVDGDPGMRHDFFAFNSRSAGRANGGLMAVVYRDSQDVVQQVEIANPQDVTTEDEKGGPFEASSIRRFYDTWGKFGGSIAPNVDADPAPESFFNATLWPELGSPSVMSELSGVLSGRFRIGTRLFEQQSAGDTHATGASFAVTVVSFDFDFHAHALSPFNFLDSSSDDWSWRRDPEREIVVTLLNLATGEAKLTVPVLLDADNLRGIYANTPASPAGNGTLPGEPLRFTENVNIAFPPLGLITSNMDNCPEIANSDQTDADGDGLGDACEGAFWMDANCDTDFDLEDTLATVSRRAGVPFDRPAACHEFGDVLGNLTIGDWDCNGEQDGGDVIAGLMSSADLGLPPTYPVTCPDPSQFISEPPG